MGDDMMEAMHSRYRTRARRIGALAVAVAAVLVVAAREPDDAWTPAREPLEFVRSLARDVVAAARTAPPKSAVGFALVTPAGRGGYPAFWIRDFSMSLESGLFPRDEIEAHLRLVANVQNGAEVRPLAHGLSVPPFAIPDHVTLDGKAVFFPGTYASGDDQGDGTYGVLPPDDDDYEFVHMAFLLHEGHGTARFASLLNEPIGGRPLLERLRRAFDVPRVDATTGAVVTDLERRSVGFGFCDGVVLTGSLCFPTLLRERAATELAELCDAAGESAPAAELRAIAATIRAHVATTFADPARDSGWLLAATGVGRQPDVWATLFALHRGVLPDPAARRALATVVDAVRRGTVTLEGAVRHVPTDRDASPDSAWERTAGEAKDTYQNGAYWHTPTGWLVEAVTRAEPKLAQRLFDEYVDHLRRGDFRLGADHGAPWECFGRGGEHAQNGAYMTSVTLPLAVFDRMVRPATR
jgi:hypothetical protein